jgi:predicted peroxiredoxin
MGQVCIYRRSINCLSLYADRGHHKLKNMNQEDINKAIKVVGSEEKLNNKKLPGMEWSFC